MESVIKKLGKTSVTVEKDYHSSEKEYNKLTVVEEQGTFKTYLSRKPVPVGTEITNREYWIPFSGVLESITFDYLKFKKDYASGKAIEDNAIITRHILDRNIERIKIALKAISEEEIDDSAIIERTIKDRNITSNKIAQENVLTEHFAKKSVITDILADYVITAIKLANDSITTRTIVNESVTQEKLANNSVNESKIVDKTITNSKIADDTIELEKLSTTLQNIINSVTNVPEDLIRLNEIDNELKKFIVAEVVRAKDAENTNTQLINDEVAKLNKTDNEIKEKLNDKTNEINVAKEEALQAIAENEQSAITNFNSQRVIPEMLSESTKQLIEASGGGTITNLADDEDLTSVDDGTGSNVLKFANRTYNPDNFSGKGYKILRKNITSISIPVTKIKVEAVPSSNGTLSFIINGKETNVSISASTDNTTSLIAQKIYVLLNSAMTAYDVSIDGSLITLSKKISGSVTPSSYSASYTESICTIEDSTKVELRNILSPSMFNQSNTTYEIRYDFILNGYIRMPHNTTLFFNGGKIIRNGQLIYGAKINGTTNEKIKVIYNNIDGDDSIYKVDLNTTNGNIVNVLDFNFDNTGTYDISEALQNLLNRFASNEKYRSVTIFFPRGTYKVTKPIITKTSNITLLGESFSIKNFGGSVSQASVINFSPEEDNMTLFPSTTFGINLKNLVFEGNSAKVTTNTEVWDGTNAQHFKLYSETKTNISCVVLRSGNVINNCAFSGFSGFAVFTGPFGELNNSYITNCNIGVNSISPDISYYTADFSVNNSVITGCNIGVICNNTFYIKNSWIDECCKYGITNFYGTKIVSTSLKVLNSHMNHIDFNGIYLKSSNAYNTLVISGCTFNRTNCYYAGYTYDNVENKEHSSTIYVENLRYSFIQFAQYYGILTDAHTGGKCSVVPIIASKSISDNVVFISGQSQQEVPIITLNDTIVGDNNINYNSKKYNLNKLIYEDDILKTGDASKRPTKVDIGFIYKDTTLNKLIIWEGSKWVNLDGSELS